MVLGLAIPHYPSAKPPGPMTEFQDRLQAVVGDTYRIIDELGGGGMSRVFLAEEVELHRKVVIKQLADYRAANRDSVLMAPYATVESIGGAQALTDVAEYISTLEISIENGKGPGTDLELGKDLYSKHCMDCHGENGEGSNEDLVPRIQAQHYKYLLRPFQWIRDGKRRNASEEMTAVSQELSDSEISAVLDYTSRLQPAEEFRALPNWKNPDFN